MKTWTPERDDGTTRWPEEVRAMAERFPPRSRWVRVGMHHDCDWFEPVGYHERGNLLMQRFSLIMGSPVGQPTFFASHRLERRNR